jgi:hypothetical protein
MSSVRLRTRVADTDLEILFREALLQRDVESVKLSRFWIVSRQACQRWRK